MLLFMDGFDHHTFLTNAIDPAFAPVKWAFNVPVSSQGWFSVAGRVGGLAARCIQGNAGPMSLVHALTQTPSTIILGFAFRGVTALRGDLCNLFDATAFSVQLNFQLVGTGQIRVFRGPGSAQIGTDSPVNTLFTNVWHYIEIKAVIATGTSGSVQVWVDNLQVLNITGVNTQASANAFVNRINLHGLVNAGAVLDVNDYDDFYVCDTTAGLGASGLPLGDSRIVTLMPSGNSADIGGHDQWAQVGGTNGNFWTSVNEVPEDGDTSYVSSATVGQIESFAHASLPATVTTVHAVQFNLVARKDDVGTRQVAPTQRNGTTDSVGATSPNLTTNYIDQLSIAENSLQTAIPWTVSEVNTSEFGVKVVS